MYQDFISLTLGADKHSSLSEHTKKTIEVVRCISRAFGSPVEPYKYRPFVPGN